MKNLKRAAALLIAVMMIFSLAACGTENTEPNTEAQTEAASSESVYKTKVAALNGPTGIGLSKLKADRGYAYDVEYHSDPQEIVPLLVKGEVDIAAVPLNLAANIYKKTNGGIQMIAVNTLGVLHVLSKDDSIKSIADLRGKTVYATGQGSTPEYILNYILEKNGIDSKNDIDIQYKTAHNELATLAVEGKVDICILPEPFASKVKAKNADMKEALDLTDEWSKVSETELAQGCLVARKEYIAQHPDLLSKFFEFAEISVNYVNNFQTSFQFLIDEGYYDSANVVFESVPGCNMVFITGEEMEKIAKENFSVLFEADPTSVGGEIPDEALYYIG